MANLNDLRSLISSTTTNNNDVVPTVDLTLKEFATRFGATGLESYYATHPDGTPMYKMDSTDPTQPRVDSNGNPVRNLILSISAATPVTVYSHHTLTKEHISEKKVTLRQREGQSTWVMYPAMTKVEVSTLDLSNL